MSNSLNAVSIVGVGYSDVGRDIALSDDLMIRQAVIAAMDDAGMTRSDIDGISTMGGNAMDIGWTLGIMPLNYFFTAGGMFGAPGPSFAEPAANEISAVASGLSRCCIAIRFVCRSGTPSRASSAASMPWLEGEGGEQQFTAPFGLRAAGYFPGFQMQAHMSRYGTTEEQFAQNAVNQRHYASMNENALLRDPLTVEEFLNSPYISKPARIYDCDYPVDAAAAVIFTTSVRALIGVKSVLSEDHAEVTSALSAKGRDRFADVRWEAAESGAVFVHGSTLWLECTIHARVPAGDHDIVLLRIVAIQAYPDVAPMVFHIGRYRRLGAL